MRQSSLPSVLVLILVAGLSAPSPTAAQAAEAGGGRSGPHAARATQGPVLVTGQGAVRGVSERQVHIFRGIPFAAAPVGPRRWQAPEPAVPWEGVRDASRFGPICPQPSGVYPWLASSPQSEDCLTLNVWTPADRNDEPLPVLVWIHGGNYQRGSGSDPQFEATPLAREGVVVVTFNYRLGPLGRFAHPALRREQAGRPSVNYDLMDQVAALEWVRDNIGAFGGDPERVTIVGHSAGAVSVNFLMISPLAKDLFHGAIAQSSGILIDVARHAWQDGPPGAEGPAFQSIGLALARDSGIEGEGPEAMAALRALPAEALIGYQQRRPYGGNPAVDGVVVPDNIAELFEQGRQHDVPYMTGSNTWEWQQFSRLPWIAQWFIAGQMIEGLGDEDFAPFEGAWNRILLSRLWFQEGVFHAPTRYLAAQMKTVRSPAFLYRYGYVQEKLRGQIPGAVHGAELVFLFDNLRRRPDLQRPENVEPTAEDFAFAELLRGYWLDFVKHGDPNGGGRPRWPAYERDGAGGEGEIMLLEPEPHAVRGLERETLDYLEKRALERRAAFRNDGA